MKTIISLTSHPKRFKTLDLCLERIISQTFTADKIVLYIAPNEKMYLPANIYNYQHRGIEIRPATPDLKPHNKYFHALKEFPNDIIITLDDDVLYPLNLIEKLMDSYKRYPYAVSTGRAHKILFNRDSTILSYEKWQQECDLYDCPSASLMATGVGGTLYPPKCMVNEVMNFQAIQNLCLYADDIWLKSMQILAHTPVVLIKQNRQHPLIIPGVAENGLFQENKLRGRNNIYIKNVFGTYNITQERIENSCQKY